jgi:hypothetical protein
VPLWREEEDESRIHPSSIDARNGPRVLDAVGLFSVAATLPHTGGTRLRVVAATVEHTCRSPRSELLRSAP